MNKRLRAGPDHHQGLDQPEGLGGLLRDAATALVIEQGLGGLDFTLVDARARMPAGTCRSYYGSQGNLVAAMLETIATRFHARLHEILQRHLGDPVAAVVEFLHLLVGPDRDEARVVWTVLLDAGVRPQITMYAEALQAGWERQIAVGLGTSVEWVRVIWPMIEGWAFVMIIRDRAMPAPEVVDAQVRALLRNAGVEHWPTPA